ncbi:hypothetical protein SELMODRAFT_85507, partial [Selaginella moellendorffii]
PWKRFGALGVLHCNLDADQYETDSKLQEIRKKRGYSCQDIITVSPEKLPNYEHKIRSFFEEHIHLDKEIRYCLDASVSFDKRRLLQFLRSVDIWVKKGDMIVLPAGSYHRFTLDNNNYVKAMRLFVGEPVWTPQDEQHIRIILRITRPFVGARKQLHHSEVFINH